MSIGRRRHVGWGIVALGAALLGVGCGGDRDGRAGWRQVVVGDLSPEERQQEQRARAACDALLLETSGVVREATRAGVDVPDIHSCGDDVRALLTRVSQEKGVMLGRTSFRLRNGDNAPPPWAAGAVASESDQDAFFRHEDGRLAALYPIDMEMACLSCHGARDQIPAALQAQFERLYPDDRATDFTYPGVRGYVWVEVGTNVE